jgi:hypothetical protein
MSVEDGRPLVSVSVDDITQDNLGNTMSRAITDNLYGINHRQIAAPVPINKDLYGLTFFTRPQLNLTTPNLRNVRLMVPLLSGDTKSYQRAIRSLLDPRLVAGYAEGNSTLPRLTSELIDNEQAFIPILTNNLLSISGWPDITLPTFTTPSGVYKEEHSIVDGLAVNYTSYDITATFRNSRGDPITSLFYYWSHYASNVFEGNLLPYPDFLIRNEIDYNTRIYRLVLDSTKRFVQRIAACGAAFPIAVPVGGIFDYSSEKPYNDVNAQIAIPFKCNGAIYNDDILIWSFNKTVEAFNPSMRTGSRESSMIVIPQDYLNLFNNRGYPYINTETYELQWWISREQFEK